MTLNLPEEKQIPDIQVNFQSQYSQILDCENVLDENYYEPSVYYNSAYWLQFWVLERGLEGDGFRLYQSGSYERAIESYNQALSNKPDDYQILNNLGLVLYSMGRYQEAIENFNKATDSNSKDNTAWNNRGNAFLKLGQHQEAIASYDKALKIKSNSHIAWNNRGNVLFGLGQYKKAIASYDKACKFELDSNVSQFKQSKDIKQKKTFMISEGFYNAWYQRGNALCSLNRYKEAVESYNEALRFVYTEYEAYYNQGNAMSKLGDHQEALKSYNSCLRYNAEFFQALVNKGNALYSLADYEQALESYDQALELNPYNCWSALYNRGNALLKLGRYSEAIDSYNEALEINDSYHFTWNNRGNAFFQLGFYSEAIDSYNEALEIKEDYFIALYNMGNALSKSKHDSFRANEIYEQALRIKPDSYDAWNNQANTLRHSYCYKEAVQSYEKALEQKFSDQAFVWSNIGSLHFDFGYLQKALEAYNQALKLKQKDHILWYYKGTILFQLGRYQEAIECYNQALELNSDNYIIWCEKANALFKLNRLEEALESYDKALQIKPDYIYALCNLCLVQSKLNLYSQASISYNKIKKFRRNYFDDWRHFFDALLDLARFSEESSVDFHENCFNRGVWLYKVGIYHEAINYFDQALRSKNDFYQAWLWRGKALHEIGEYQKAIDSFKQALKYKSDLPEAWYSMGKALYEIGHYHKAVDSFRQALKFQSNYYAALYYIGIVFYKLNRYHEAIDSYDQALRFKPDDLYSLYNRGLSLFDLGRLHLTINQAKTWLKGAIRDFRRVLRINNQTWQAWRELGWATFYNSDYEQALAIWTEGIKIIQSTTPVNLEGCGVLYYACGCANYEYSKQQWHTEKDRLDFWQKARSDFQEALEFFSAKDMCQRRLEVLEELIKVCRDLGETAQVRALGKDGTAILQLLLQETTSEKKRIQLKRKFSGLAGLQIDNLAKSFKRSHQVKAIEEAEQHKNDCLSWFQNNHSHNVNFSPKYSDIQKLLDSHTAIIYWHISPVAFTTFILKYQKPLLVWHYQQSPNIFIRSCQRFVAFLSNLFKKEHLLKQNSPSTKQLQKFETWVVDWKQNHKNYLKDREGNFNSRLAELANILDTKEISSYLSGIDNLILIPHRDLHLLPLEVLFSGQFSVSRLPSAQIGIARVTHNSKLDRAKIFSSFPAQLEKNVSLLSVENPRNDLRFASIESSAICQFYPPFKHLQGQEATKDKVTAALETYISHGAFHFTGHGYHNIDEPLESALCLANEEYLTLRNIFGLDLSRYQLVCLSACETGITGKRDLIDEFVGLASGFLSAGATCVTSSLWAVNDLSTALFMIKFYENLKFYSSVPLALNAAQIWLRESTQADLLAWSRQLSLEQRFKKKIEASLDWYNGDEKPYARPHYWAAFFTVG